MAPRQRRDNTLVLEELLCLLFSPLQHLRVSRFNQGAQEVRRRLFLNRGVTRTRLRCSSWFLCGWLLGYFFCSWGISCYRGDSLQHHRQNTCAVHRCRTSPWLLDGGFVMLCLEPRCEETQQPSIQKRSVDRPPTIHPEAIHQCSAAIAYYLVTECAMKSSDS